MIVLEHARQGSGHEGFAQPDHVADDDAAPFVQMMRGDFYGGRLKVKEFVAEVFGDTKFGQPGAGFLREVVRHFDVDVIRRDQVFACPTLVENFDQLVGDLDAPAVVPSVFKPLGEFLARVVVQHVHVQFPLARQPREREVAAAQVSHRRVDRIGAEQQVKLGVKRMPEKQFDDDLVRLDLLRQSSQTGFVFIGRRADR